MATQEVLAARRNEALDRIDKVIATIADAHGVKYGALFNIRHNDPEIAAAIRVETLARILSDIAAAQEKASAQTQLTASLSTADTLRNAVLGATDDDLLGLPGVGERSLPAWREWAKSLPEVAMPVAVEAPTLTGGTSAVQPAPNVVAADAARTRS